MKVKSAYKLKCDFDWNAYSTLFPTRYLKESRLDFELHKIVSDISLRLSWIKTEVKILDVGGGPQFTPALRRMIPRSNVKLHLLDPFVTLDPKINFDLTKRGEKAICFQIDWSLLEDIQSYDLIVLRGSLNYLTLDEIEILGAQLKLGGILIANSFVEPDEIKRRIVTEIGIKGTEECTAKVVDGYLKSTVMQHTLTLDKKIFKHEFFYHPPMHVINKLGPSGVTAEFYGRNSILYKYKKS